VLVAAGVEHMDAIAVLALFTAVLAALTGMISLVRLLKNTATINQIEVNTNSTLTALQARVDLLERALYLAERSPPIKGP
jgi:hypothetical protein